jgi:RNA polymerase sigma-70 factor (ECF subfamily)
MTETESRRDDSELIRLCLDGEREAFDALAARYYRGIYNMVYRMIGNAEDASDLTQETFLRAYTRMETFDLARPFLAWIRRIATNLCIDRLRHRRDDASSLDQHLESGRQYADESPETSPAEAMEMAEDSRRVLAAVQRLPAKQRAVLVLRHVEGLKLEEIARTLRMPLGTVKTLLFRGRHAVREMVGEL